MTKEENKSISLPMITPFLIAVQFLTVLPAALNRIFKDDELGKAVGYFPLVGLLIGAILAGGGWLFSYLFPPAISTILLMALWLALSGALHFDGLLDSFDGLFGGHTPEQRLEIMKDERVGAFGLAAGIMVVLLRYYSLLESNSIQLLLLSPVLARWAVSMLMVVFPYGRAVGLGKTMKDNASYRQLLIASVIAAGAAWFFAGSFGLIALLIIGVFAMLLGYFVMRKIPGLTGDIYGLVIELGEVLVILLFAMEGWRG